MNISLKDPEILREQTETITLTRVKIWEIPFGFSVDELVQQTLQFTFEGVGRFATGEVVILLIIVLVVILVYLI